MGSSQSTPADDGFPVNTTALSNPRYKQLYAKFVDLDTDKNTVLNLAEFQAYLKANGGELSDDDVKLLFSNADKSGDSNISASEFVAVHTEQIKYQRAQRDYLVSAILATASLVDADIAALKKEGKEKAEADAKAKLEEEKKAALAAVNAKFTPAAGAASTAAAATSDKKDEKKDDKKDDKKEEAAKPKTEADKKKAEEEAKAAATKANKEEQRKRENAFATKIAELWGKGGLTAAGAETAAPALENLDAAFDAKLVVSLLQNLHTREFASGLASIMNHNDKAAEPAAATTTAGGAGATATETTTSAAKPAPEYANKLVPLVLQLVKDVYAAETKKTAEEHAKTLAEITAGGKAATDDQKKVPATTVTLGTVMKAVEERDGKKITAENEAGEKSADFEAALKAVNADAPALPVPQVSWNAFFLAIKSALLEQQDGNVLSYIYHRSCGPVFSASSSVAKTGAGWAGSGLSAAASGVTSATSTVTKAGSSVASGATGAVGNVGSSFSVCGGGSDADTPKPVQHVLPLDYKLPEEAAKPAAAAATTDAAAATTTTTAAAATTTTDTKKEEATTAAAAGAAGSDAATDAPRVAQAASSDSAKAAKEAAKKA